MTLGLPPRDATRRRPPPAPRAILFDLDGTLVDSRRDIANACNAALEAMGRSRLPDERVRAMIGDGARALVARALSVDLSHPDVAPALEAFQAAYATAPTTHTVLLPGAREALHALPRPFALVTNKPRAMTELVLAGLGLDRAFDHVYAGGDGPLKPSPAGVTRALEALSRGAADAWLVGDGPQDVAAGRAAGVYTIAVPGLADVDAVEAERPDAWIASLGELADLSAPPAARRSP
ncbi:MAG: HAD-IA family hydrolase [Myxococcales bacterium]|nr:HAD-IA family hydrolase [Myxococcales bacterium]